MPRRDFGRDTNYRPGPRGFRDGPAFDNRSPLRAPRDRSPLPLKRGREISPAGSRGRRSPPPQKRERLASPPRSRFNAYPPSREPSPPRGRPYSPQPGVARRLTPPRGVTRAYRPASRSPVRLNEHNDPRKVDWRRRSPSPPRPNQNQNRPDLITGETSAAPSVTSSRRSSPPIHPSRLAVIEPEERVITRPPPPRDDFPPRQPYRARSPITSRPRSPVHQRPRSPPPVHQRSPLPVAPRPSSPSPPPAVIPVSVPTPTSAARSPVPPRRRESPPPSERDVPPTGPRAPPTGPASYAQNDTYMKGTDEVPPPRAPPTGPGGHRSYAQAASDVATPNIPTGPRPSVLSPPTHPRGGPPGRGGFQRDYPPRGDYQGRGRGGPYGGNSYRGGRGGGLPPPSYGRDQQQDFPSGPPSGPRSSFSGPPGFRQNNAAPMNAYTRSNRFGSNAGIPSGPKADMAATGGYVDRNRKPSNPYLADLPRVVEGGQKAPDLYDHSRLDRLESEAENLRRVIEDKQQKKRKAMREWERLSRETEGAIFRAQLAEDSVRALAGEGDGGAAF